jgi:4-amino-4-deoxy-L-arabinose transferase-like glycosyltransferase
MPDNISDNRSRGIGQTIITDRKAMPFIIVAALVLRTVVPFVAFAVSKDSAVFRNPDTIEYIEPAQNLLTSGSFAAKGVPEIERTPGYALFFIPGILSGHIDAVTIALQIVLSCLCVLLVYKIGILLFDDENIAVLAAALYAVEPMAIVYASLLYSETLYATAFLFFLYLLLRYTRTDALRHLARAAVVLAVTAYIRPVSYFLPALVTALLFLRTILTRGLDRRLLFHAVAFFVIAMSLIAVWQVRNKIEADYSGFSAITAQNLYFYVAAQILANTEDISLREQRARMGYGNPAVYFELHPEQRAWGQSRIYQYRASEGVKVVLHYPWSYFLICVKGIVTTFRDSGAGMLGPLLDVNPDSPRGKQLTRILRFPLFAVLFVHWCLAGVGFLARRWISGWQMVIVTAVSLYLLLVPAFSGTGYARFRHPVMPLVCVMAGCGLSVILNRFSNASALKAPGHDPERLHHLK